MNTAAKKQLSIKLVDLQAWTAAFIVMLMPVHAFLSTWLGTAIGPLLLWKSWKELLILAVAPITIWYVTLRPQIAKAIWQRPLNKVIAVYAALHLVMSVFSTASSQAVIAGLMFNLRFLAIFVLVQVVAEANAPLVRKLRDVAPRWLLWTAVGLGALAILQVFVLPKDFLVQFGYNKDTTIAPYILVDQNPQALRAFATMRGPNALGAFLLLPLAVALYSVYQKRRDMLAWAALALGLVGLGLTGSRSAWLGAIVMGVAMAAILLPRAQLVRWARRGILPAILVIAAIGWGVLTIPGVRLAIFHSSPGDSSLNEGSNDKHWEATAKGIADVVRHPLGSGPGNAGPASFYNTSGTNVSEDYYVQIAQEVGIFGLALFVAVCWFTVRAIVRRTPGVLPVALLASFVGISFINILLHGWADDPLSITWWALAGLFIGKK